MSKATQKGVLISIIFLMVGSIQVSAQISCIQKELPNYFVTIRNGTDAYKVKGAAECVAKLAPSEDTAQVLINRLDRTLQETLSLKPDDSAFDQGRIAAALAEALDIMKNKEGYKKIEEYFANIDWNIPRDLWFFDSIAAHGAQRSELTETFYLALTRMPASAGSPFSRACSMFHRMSDTWIVRDEPRFIHGILSALSRIEHEAKELMKKYEKHEDLKKEIKNRSLYLKETCEETLLSQLLDEKMRLGFLKSFHDKLSADERRILDSFLVKIAPPPEKDVVDQLTEAFFSVPWKEELSGWQKGNPEISCETFRGEGFVTHADDLWCSLCSTKTGPLEKRFYFYPDVAGKACTLQKVRFSYSTTAKETLKAVSKRLTTQMGPGKPKPEVHDFGSGFWEDISFWNWEHRGLKRDGSL